MGGFPGKGGLEDRVPLKTSSKWTCAFHAQESCAGCRTHFEAQRAVPWQHKSHNLNSNGGYLGHHIGDDSRGYSGGY